jgi:hypothetical protein
MSQIITLTTAEGFDLKCEITQVQGVAQSLRFFDIPNPDQVDYWRSYFEDFTQSYTEYLLSHTTNLTMKTSCTGIYIMHRPEGGVDKTEPIVMSSLHPAKITRHSSLERKIRNQFLAVHDPVTYHRRLENDYGSNIGILNQYEDFTVDFEFPYAYNAMALPANYRLHKCDLTGFLQYCPYNSDNYCVLHSIFAGKQKLHAGKSLNNNADYMASFNTWFTEHNLDRFYIDGFFVLDNVEKLEKELKVNINFYTFESELELFYRSGYLNDGDIFNLVVIPMKFFYNNHTKPVPAIQRTKAPLIHPQTDLSKEFISAVNIKNLITKRDGHCALLDPGIFRKRNKNGTLQQKYAICKYCTANVLPHNIPTHEENCRTTFHDSKQKDRIRNYKELKPGNDVKNFDKYYMFYQAPFCVYDFETRVNDEGRHVPFSYSIIYLNIFDITKSIRFIESSQDPNLLLELFLKDVKTLAIHHHDLQSVDEANPEERNNAELPEGNICPYCLQNTPEENFEFNHSHFQGDKLNLAHNRYICKTCNLKTCIRQKPLKFYGHNASRFDNYLFMERLINSKDFKNFQFLAKTESRFTQVTCAVVECPKAKISFNDSRMIVSGSLADLAKAWIAPGVDDPKIAALLKLFHPDVGDNDITKLVQISREKAIFPYTALNDEKLLKEKIIPQEYFDDTLYGTKCDDEDYQSYLTVNQTLEHTLGYADYNFQDYHDYYLMLDVVLLALILDNFFKINLITSKINPMWSLSVSSFSFTSLLVYNKYSTFKIPEIKIPQVQVQKFLQKSIRGGFSQIFNKRMPKFKAAKDLCFYIDFNSMYPSAMATKKLPYEFSRWVPVDKSIPELLQELESLSDSKYFFMEVDIDPLAPKCQNKASKLPLFPENREIQPEWLSEDQKHRYYVNTKNEFEPTTINCVTFFEKKNYITSYSYLKMALDAGYTVSKIHNIAEFKADYVMADYVKEIYGDKRSKSIEKNALTKKIKALQAEGVQVDELNATLSAVECRIACAKIKANGLYGATIINQDRHSETEMIESTNVKLLKKRISSLRFKSLYMADKMVLINSDKASYNLSYPLSLGSAILWESKIMMGTFVYTLYEYLKSNGLKMNPMMTDTDSFCVHVPNFKRSLQAMTSSHYVSMLRLTAFSTPLSTSQNFKTQPLMRNCAL